MEGFGWFTYHAAKYLVENNPEIQFYFLFDRKFDKQFVFGNNVKPVVLFPQARHPLLFKWWFDYSVTSFLKREKIDLFISPDGYLSLRTDVPQIGVIHDLNFEHYPDDLKPHHSRYLRKYFPKFAQKAAHIVTVSEFSKLDIQNTYQISSGKISVAYNGVNPIFHPKESLKESSNPPFFLFVGSIHPRKNLKRLLQAFDVFKSSVQSEHRLLIVGDPYYWSEEMKAALENVQHIASIDFHKYASLDELLSFYQEAEALMFISYFEGFGIPVVEAMACGCPVLVGKNTACDEVSGDAALKINPFDIKEIADAMIRISQNKSLKDELITLGFEQSKKFTWNNTGKVMNEVMHRYLNG